MNARHRLVRATLGLTACAALALLCGPHAVGQTDKAAEKRFSLNMEKKPWPQVFAWLAETAGVPVIAEQTPTGTFSFIGPPKRTYTLTEVIDLLNDGLGTSTIRMRLVRRPNSLQLTAYTPTTIAVLPLRELDAARTVALLRGLFKGERDLNLEAETVRNAIVVRGTSEQLAEIKKALTVLGESEKPAPNIRLVITEHGDAAALADSLADILPKMRANPVEVIAPETTARSSSTMRSNPVRVINLGKVDPKLVQEAITKLQGKPAPATAPGSSPPPAVKEPPKDHRPGSATVPIRIFATGNRLMMMSEDANALALAEQLARLYLSPHQGGPEVIRLRHSTATDVARALDELFNGKNAERSERVRIVAEPISNVLLVKAAPLDLLTIRRLLTRTLDTPREAAEGEAKTYRASLKNAVAADVAKALRHLFTVDGKSPVAVGVDERSNAVIFSASAKVAEEVRKVIEAIDKEPAKKK